MNRRPTVGIVVVNWNDAERTRRCLSSLFALKSSEYEVCVVDNGSAEDGTPIWRAGYPLTQVIRLGENRGYAGACNVGIAWAERHGHQYVLILNNDTTVAADALDPLVSRSLELSDSAILAPKILASRSPGRIWFAGGRLRWPWLEREHIGIGASDGEYNSASSIEWASGCALFFPVSLARAVGALDERYFLYLEDVEWCLRARRQGYGVWYVPQARVWHDVSRTVDQVDSRLLRYYACRNSYLLVFSHAGPIGRCWSTLRLIVTAAKSGVRLLLFPSYREDLNYVAQTRALVDVVRRRFGKAPYSDRIAADLPAAEGVAG